MHTRDRFLEDELRLAHVVVEETWDADVVSYLGGIDDKGAGALKDVLEDIQSNKDATQPKKSRLVVNLETYGGFVESSERMANIMRHHYSHVEFVVTTYVSRDNPGDVRR